MYNYELYLVTDVDGASVHFITTDHRIGNFNTWLEQLVKENTISRDVAKNVLYVA